MVSRDFMASNVIFYSNLVVEILFFWNWFDVLSPGFMAVGDDVVKLTWVFIGVALPPLSAAMGISMLKSDR